MKSEKTIRIGIKVLRKELEIVENYKLPAHYKQIIREKLKVLEWVLEDE